MLNIKLQSSPTRDRVNNGDNSEVVIGNGNNNEGKNSKKPNQKYVKVLVKDPLNNRDILLKVTKKQNPRLLS